jgi:hypothetical protein
MRQIILCSLTCLLLVGCTMGIAKREALTPAPSSLEITPSPGVTQTGVPITQPLPTETLVASSLPSSTKTPVPVALDTPTETPVPAKTSDGISPSLVDGWRGTIVKLPSGAQFDDCFEREDGERFGIGGTIENIDAVESQLVELQWTGAQVQVWGDLLTSVPDCAGRQIAVERIEVISGPAEEARNLTPFAETAASSFLLVDRVGQYQSWMAIDTFPETAWVEGATGPGVGEWITLTFPDVIEIHRISLDVGYDRDKDIFFANNRIKKATLIFSNGEQIELEFADTRGMQTIPLVRAPGPNIETTFVTIIIEDIYPGTKYDDTCLAEVEIWGRTR